VSKCPNIDTCPRPRQVEGFVNFAIADAGCAADVRDELLAQRARLTAFMREQMSGIIAVSCCN
jgi:hypothetical protein